MVPVLATTRVGGFASFAVARRDFRYRAASGPAPTSSSRAARERTASADIDSSDERKAHWSKYGSRLFGSKKTVASDRRHFPWSGNAMRFPNVPFGSKPCEGKKRS
jgi:hypothetical protein